MKCKSFILLLSLFWCSAAASEEKIYVLLYDHQPMVGLDDLPALGLEVRYLFVDAYEKVINEAQVAVESNIPRNVEWVKNNPAEVSRITRGIIYKLEQDILASLQDKVTAINLSKTYGINTFPTILMLGSPGEYKIMRGEINIAKAFNEFKEMPYEKL